MDSVKAVATLRMIAADMAADARAFDGQPFNGRTVAEYLGNHGAAIAAIANIVADLWGESPVSVGAVDPHTDSTGIS